jgi:hypothetical protein
MPKTTAVRKAKDTMAASTLSLVRSSIAASSAGTSRRLTQVAPRQPGNLSGKLPTDQQNSMLQRNNSMIRFDVSQLHHHMMHNNNVQFGLIQEGSQIEFAVFIDY